MSEEVNASASDDDIVKYIRKWAVERSRCRLNFAIHNRIMDQRLFPAQAILAARGVAALRKLLPLTKDTNSSVRWVAASFAYDAAPEICRSVLEELIAEPDVIRLLAWATLAHKSPEAPPDLSLLGGEE
jgi:hypothetical protein